MENPCNACLIKSICINGCQEIFDYYISLPNSEERELLIRSNPRRIRSVIKTIYPIYVLELFDKKFIYNLLNERS